MKKTIIILILVIYIASIAIVNFFGLAPTTFDGVTYVESIICNTVTVQNENGGQLPISAYLGDTPLFKFNFIPAPEGSPYTEEDESIVSNPNAVQINYEVLPHLADDTNVRFKFDKEAMAGVAVFHEPSKSLIFLKSDVILYITIEAVDGHGAQTTVAVWGQSSVN